MIRRDALNGAPRRICLPAAGRYRYESVAHSVAFYDSIAFSENGERRLHKSEKESFAEYSFHKALFGSISVLALFNKRVSQP